MRVHLKVTWLLICFLIQYNICSGQESSTLVSDESSDVPVAVDDYLETLSDDELHKICHDRGFEIAPDHEPESISRQDLIEGARRCLSLEDEMNAILAEHPELAAELDKEIERMRAQKEQLEKEREEMLVQKELLEKQLRDAGVDIGSSNSTSIASRPAVPDTVEGVLKESFIQLHERVMQDVQVARKLLAPVIKQVDRVWHFVWRYSKPILGDVLDKARKQIETFKNSQSSQTS